MFLETRLDLAEAETVEICTSSGKVDVTLAAEGAEVLYTSDSGRLRTDCTYERKGDLYVSGNGASNITVETASSNLEIK